MGVVYSQDGKRLASGSGDGTVKVWDAASGQEVFTVQGNTGLVYDVEFAAHGERLASGGGPPKKPGEVKLWDATTGKDAVGFMR